MEASGNMWAWDSLCTDHGPIVVDTSPLCSQKNDFDLIDPTLFPDLLDDLSGVTPFKAQEMEQDFPAFDEDWFLNANIDDFILFPDSSKDDVTTTEETCNLQRVETEASTTLSPVSTISGSISSPVSSQGSPETTNTDLQRPRRRRRNGAVFPCELCTRVCFTSVEARRHHARHIKPFKCEEPMVFLSQPQPSRHIAPSSSSAPSSSTSSQTNCGKAFATKNELERHRKSVHYCVPEVGPREWYQCPIDGCKVAGRLWPRRDNLLVHMKQSHPKCAEVQLKVYVPENDGLLLQQPR